MTTLADRIESDSWSLFRHLTRLRAGAETMDIDMMQEAIDMIGLYHRSLSDEVTIAARQCEPGLPDACRHCQNLPILCRGCAVKQWVTA